MLINQISVFHCRNIASSYNIKPDEIKRLVSSTGKNNDVFEELSNFVEENIVDGRNVVSMPDSFHTYIEIKSQ